MQASRVTLTPSTMQKAQLNLSDKAKRELRENLIIEYIKSRPYGKRIKLVEFANVGSFKGDGHAHMFVNRMLQKNLIHRHIIEGRRMAYFYTVPEEVRIIKPPRVETEIPSPKSEVLKEDPVASTPPPVSKQASSPFVKAILPAAIVTLAIIGMAVGFNSLAKLTLDLTINVFPAIAVFGCFFALFYSVYKED